MKKYLNISAIILIAWFLSHSFIIIFDGLTDDASPADLIVVLGSKVNEDGTPSARLTARCEKAAELFHQGLADKILVSGGLGKEGYYEAEIMKSVLHELDVPNFNIHVDNKGNTTLSTAINTAKFMQESNLSSVIIITQYFHITRTRLAFKNQEISNISTAHANITELRDLYSILREFPAYYKYLFQ